MTKAALVPALRYYKPKSAIAFLEEAFGFERHAVYEENGKVLHAQLTFGGSMMMLGPMMESEFGRLIVQPDQTGGRVTQAVYVIVPDVDAHYERAQKKGAQILIAPRDQDYGGRDYTAADTEGHVWTFGDYDPWATHEG